MDVFIVYRVCTRRNLYVIHLENLTQKQVKLSRNLKIYNCFTEFCFKCKNELRHIYISLNNILDFGANSSSWKNDVEGILVTKK